MTPLRLIIAPSAPGVVRCTTPLIVAQEYSDGDDKQCNRQRDDGRQEEEGHGRHKGHSDREVRVSQTGADALRRITNIAGREPAIYQKVSGIIMGCQSTYFSGSRNAEYLSGRAV